MFKSFSLRVASALAVVVMLGLMFTAGPASAESTTVTEVAAPKYGQRIPWAAFQGAPTIRNGQTDIWVWNENVSGQNRLHIRTTTDASAHTFAGTVTTGAEGNFYNLALFNGDGDDSATMVGYNQLTFSIVTTAGGEGADVDWSGRWLVLDLFIDGYHRPAHVLFGANAKAASQVPLIVLAGKNGLLTLPLTMLDGPTGFQKNVADGYFIYRDVNGYHMRLTTTKVGDIVDYRGAIVADSSQFGAIRMFKGDSRDYYRLMADKILAFRFITDGGEDGLDWRLIGSGGLTFTLRMNGRVASPNVSLGSNPFGTIQALTFRLTP